MITIQRVNDPEIVKYCMLDDDILKTVAEDNINNMEYEPDFIRTCWIAMRFAGELMGVISFDAKNSVSVEMHIGVFAKFRGKKAYEATKLALIWLINEFPCYKKVVAFIPITNKNVKMFALQIGFKEEGLNRQSYIKNGEIIDQWFMGITQEEIKEISNARSV